MDKEQIYKIAEECGFGIMLAENGNLPASWVGHSLQLIERFAAAIRAATKEEDAKICASIAEQTVMSDNYQAKECESTILASK